MFKIVPESTPYLCGAYFGVPHNIVNGIEEIITSSDNILKINNLAVGYIKEVNTFYINIALGKCTKVPYEIIYKEQYCQYSIVVGLGVTNYIGAIQRLKNDIHSISHRV